MDTVVFRQIAARSAQLQPAADKPRRSFIGAYVIVLLIIALITLHSYCNSKSLYTSGRDL